jgi:predicted nucleic acid-binding protein
VTKAVIDSSSLIYLTYLDLTLKLSQFFDVVLVPDIVEKEVNRKHRFRYRMKSFYESGVFKRCVVSNEWNRRLLQYDQGIDAGEAEAITQAQEQEAPVFIGDEKAARESAQRKGKISIGTAGILARLYIQGIVTAHPRELIRKLRRSKIRCRISDKVIEEAMQRAHEPLF